MRSSPKSVMADSGRRRSCLRIERRSPPVQYSRITHTLFLRFAATSERACAQRAARGAPARGAPAHLVSYQS